MAIPVTLAGTTYQIPETGETEWGDEVTNYLVALSNATFLNDFKIKTRRVTVSPIAVTATDCIIVSLVPSAATVNLPSGVLNKVYGVSDGTGNASVNPITINTAGGQLINGSTSYVIREDWGFVLVAFDGTQWNVISEGKTPIRSIVYRLNNSINASLIDASVVRNSSVPLVPDLQSCSFDLTGSEGMLFTVSLSTGRSIICQTDYESDVISCLSDHDNIFLTQDSGTGIYPSKPLSSSTITIKNRMGLPVGIEIKSLTNSITNVTNWS